MRWMLPALLAIGFPTWMWYWISSPHVLVYMYAMMGYAALTATSAGWAARCLPWSRTVGQ